MGSDAGGAARHLATPANRANPTAPASGSLRDGNEHLELRLPSLRRLLVLLARAVTLRCPQCGGGPVLEHWFRMRSTCARCARSLERGERDYFLGGMLFNLILAELLFASVFVTALVVMWPTVPWDAIAIAAPIGVALAPLVLYPVSRLVWLAVDLAVRPDQER